ncbi:hypothetical protein Tco_1545702, partial [Tanacetum coccineum]
MLPIGGGRTRGRSGDQGDGRNDGPGGQVGGQGSEVNGGVDGVPNFSTIIAQQLQNLLPTIVAQVGSQGRGQGVDIEPSDLGFSYEIEIASGQLVEIDKVIKGCKLEIEVVRIPLLDGKKQEEIVIVRDFPEVFPDDLSGLPLVREIEFWIELIPGAMLVAKSSYRLAPSELEELSGQLK